MQGAREIADSLYADLYGLENRDGNRQSLFRYYQGRSSLATWLRAVLAQRYVDRLRAQRRVEPLPGELPGGSKEPDPNRTRYVALVRQALERAYPPVMRDAGIGGATIVWALIDEKGAVPKTQLRTSSGFPDLDAAALWVTRTMRFSPGLNRDRAVKVWVQLPIIFKADPNAPYDPVRSSRLAQEAAPQGGRVAPGAAPAAIASAERADAAGIARKAGEPARTETGKALAAAPGIDTTKRGELNALVAVGYGSRQAAKTREPHGAVRPQAITTGDPAPMAGVVAVADLPIIRSLPRIGPGELSRVLQRLPSGDTIEVVALAPAGTTEGQPTVADGPRALAQQAAWSGAARPGAITVSRTNAQGTVTIRGVLPRESLETLLRRVRFPRQQATDR